MARNHDDGPVVKSAKKDWMKGDCLSISKKLALLKEFEECKNSGVRNPNKEILRNKFLKIKKNPPVSKRC